MKMKEKKYPLFLYITFTALSRIIFHPANMTPVDSLCLFAGSKFSKLFAIIYILVCIAISDLLLMFFSKGHVFGLWSIFTYSAYVFIVYLGKKLPKNYSFYKLAAFSVTASLIFWLFSNFGWWLTTPFYSKDFTGFLNCYIASLPFLRNTLLGDMCWVVVIFGVYSKLSQFFEKSHIVTLDTTC